MKSNSNIDLAGNELQNAAIHNLSTAPTDPAVGQLYFNTSDSTTYQWTGTEWVAMKGITMVQNQGWIDIWLVEDGLYYLNEVWNIKAGGTYKGAATGGLLKVQTLNGEKKFYLLDHNHNYFEGYARSSGYGDIRQYMLYPFKGALSSQSGITGLVPAPSTADRNKFLCGDGTWKEGPKTLRIIFGNVYDREHHIDYWVPQKTKSTYYTINELTQLLQEGYMIIAIAGTSSAAGNYYYPDVRWNGQTSNQLLFRKTGVEDGRFMSRLLELNSSDYPGYGEVWKINTEFSI